MKPVFALFVLLTASVSGASQLRTNYIVLSEVTDAGGLHSTSASYANDGSFASFGGIVTASSPQEVVRIGYVGQLFETTAFMLTAASTNLNEGASLPLKAMQFIDDGTVSPASSFAQWSFTGPLTSIDASGVATAANVYQDMPATVQAGLEGWTASLNLMVVNVGNDDFGIYAGDGIPDGWQVQYFGTNNPSGTGRNVLFKYTAGLNPTNPASVFAVNLTKSNGLTVVVFSPCLTNRVYTLQYADSLASGNFVPLTGMVQSDNGNSRVVTDLTATNASRFYRVQISYP